MSSMKPVHDVTKLPRWAQGRIATLERQVSRLEAALGADAAQHPAENLHVRDPRTMINDIPTPHRSAKFKFGDRHYIRFARTERGVEVRASDRLVIEPHSSNVATLAVVPF